jgi:DNA modification methylase
MESRIVCGDALEELRRLPAGIAASCVTSPPYWGLRDYGTGRWEGGSSECDHLMPRQINRHRKGDKNATNLGSNPTIWKECGRCGARRVDLQLGLEETPDLYVERLVEIFREVRRVLLPSGTLWLVLGDSYASGQGTCYNPGGGEGSLGKARKEAGAEPLDRGNVSALARAGLKPKDLVGFPWRVAFALQRDGWWLRSDIVWVKTNPMPESVKDRPTRSHEYIFLLSRAERYYYDHAAIREPHESDHLQGNKSRTYAARDPLHAASHKLRPRGYQQFHPAGRNRRDVWFCATCGYRGAHFAVFPEELIEPIVLASSALADLVLDPFLGSGTVAAVAKRLGRRYIGIELNAQYAAMAEKRVAGVGYQEPLPIAGA